MKLKFGNQPGITLNLPSKRPGERHLLTGKAIINLDSLKYSERAEFNASSLAKYAKKLTRIERKLSGEIALTSECKRLTLDVAITRVEHVEVKVKLRSNQFSRPHNVMWNMRATFAFEPSLLKRNSQRN